jgi:hypothetical protein
LILAHPLAKRNRTPKESKSVYKKNGKTTKEEEMEEKNEECKQGKRNVNRVKRYSLDFRKSFVSFLQLELLFYTWSPAFFTPL